MAAPKHWAFSVVIALSLLLLISPGPRADDSGHPVNASAPEDLRAVASATAYAYRNYSETAALLAGIESQHPEIAEVYDIGDSWEKIQSLADRDILALKISDNVGVNEDEPEILITALHHAREWISTEIAIALAERLTDEYGTDPQVSWLVDNREVWIVPIVNPDGLDYSLAADQMWRKNRRLNIDLTYGVDLNRNYNGSSNGDPLGAWGGAGSSGVPSNEVYRGTAPFSEPETQAIRDLVLGHDFAVAIDFHSFGDMVLWPWGYTSNQTPDNGDLSRIGSELAAANGYLAEQSVGLYPTTGDSIDWMYGAEHIYAFTIEVGADFHPTNASVVNQTIGLNVDTAILGIDIAGDREEKSLSILHVPMNTANFTHTGFNITATVTADRGVNVSQVEMFYSLDGHNWTGVQMTRLGGNDTYVAHLPPTEVWHGIDYYFQARDLGGVAAVAPEYAPYWMYGLLVTPPEGLVGGVDFYIPHLVDGTFGYEFNASVTDNYPEPLRVELRLRGRHNFTFDWGFGSGPNYRICDLPPGIPLDNYSARLVALVFEFEVWSSPEFELLIADRTAPKITGVTANLLEAGDGRVMELAIRCSDYYGVASVTVEYRFNGDAQRSLIRTESASQLDPDTWAVFLPLPDEEGYIEYRVIVRDYMNGASLPSDEGFTLVAFGPRESDHGWLVIVLIGAALAAAVAAIVYIVIRARRRQASGP